MTYRGHIENGVVVLDDHARIPEGTPVQVWDRPDVRDDDPAPESPGDLPDEDAIPTLYERLEGLIGTVDLPEDFAEQHDHYLHGTPKR